MAGVFQGKVVLVGKNTCRALSLADGKQQLWQVETGLPSGQGAASGPYYFLPLKKGEVCQIDLEKGQVVARSASPKNEIPGNLLFYEGEVISQTETEVTCYPQVEYKVAQITDLLKKNPKDPNALTERGELRLYKGDLAGAVADLREAVQSRPSGPTLPKARAKLYATLTELLQRDFNAAEKYLDEYKELCKVEIPSETPALDKQKLEEERHRRQSGYLYLLAEGRVKQGRLMEAFQAYLDFGALAGNNELVSVINEPAVKARPDVWARGRIAALVAKASPQQREQLESEIAKRWKAVQDSKDLESLRRFVAAFGSVFAVGREARLRLAERLIEENSPLEAEGHLLQLRQQDQDPQIAGRAVEALARLMTRKGLLEDAAYYYRILGRDFAKTLIREGKTGADIFNDLGTDKRFLPYLEEVAAPLMSGALKVAEIKGGRSANPQPWVFEPRGELTPFFEHHRLVWGTVHMNNTPRFQLDLVADDGSHDEWSLTSTTRVPYDWSSMNAVRVPCFVRGHLAVLYLGHTLFGVDFIERRKLWERDLLARDQQRLESLAQQALMFRLDGEGGLYLIASQGSQQKLGQVGALTKSYLCLRTPEGLEAVDPLHGTILWKKADVSAHTQIFGDDEYLYLAEVRDDRSVGTTRVIRGSDGAAVDVPDFSLAYQHRQRILGGQLLVSESGPSGRTVLRLYDVRTGKDVWKKELPAGSLVLRVEEPELAATITPDGKLSVVDLRTKQELLEGSVKAEHVDKATEGLLLRDSLQYYVTLNNGSERNANLQGPTPNLSALSSALVNKAIYAFRWDDSKAKWRLSWYFDELPNQAMLLERFKDLPMVFLSSRYDEVVKDAGLGAVRKVVATISIEKRSGKRIWNEKPLGNPPVTGPFHTLEIDHQTAQVQLIGDRVRLVHYVGDAPPKEALAPRASRSRVWEGELAGEMVPVPVRRPFVRNAPP
jgi:hypothetical protein